VGGDVKNARSYTYGKEEYGSKSVPIFHARVSAYRLCDAEYLLHDNAADHVVVTYFPPQRPWSYPWSGHAVSVVDMWNWGKFSPSTWFTLLTLSPPNALYSFITRGWFNRPNRGCRAKCAQPHPPQEIMHNNCSVTNYEQEQQVIVPQKITPCKGNLIEMKPPLIKTDLHVCNHLRNSITKRNKSPWLNVLQCIILHSYVYKSGEIWATKKLGMRWNKLR
jgi:hypothetical protein